MKLEEARRGQKVTYHPHEGYYDHGEVVEANDRYVFVSYEHTHGRAIATEPEDLLIGIMKENENRSEETE